MRQEYIGDTLISAKEVSTLSMQVQRLYYLLAFKNIEPPPAYKAKHILQILFCISWWLYPTLAKVIQSK
jgi:hypothetical protein